MAKVEGEITNENELVINVCELARRLHLSRSLAYQLIRQEDFPVLKIGKRRLIPIVGLNEWITQNSATH